MGTLPLTARDAERSLAGRVRDGRELFAGLAEALESWGARAASLSLWGPVSGAVTGVFDAIQGVYATTRVAGSWEISSCSGLWLPREGGRPGLSLWATLSDTGGRVVAGRLFPEVPAVSVAFAAREISGADPAAGQDSWAWPPAGRDAG